jgi:hypothetical protein
MADRKVPHVQWEDWLNLENELRAAGIKFKKVSFTHAEVDRHKSETRQSRLDVDKRSVQPGRVDDLRTRILNSSKEAPFVLPRLLSHKLPSGKQEILDGMHRYTATDGTGVTVLPAYEVTTDDPALVDAAARIANDLVGHGHTDAQRLQHAIANFRAYPGQVIEAVARRHNVNVRTLKDAVELANAREDMSETGSDVYLPNNRQRITDGELTALLPIYKNSRPVFKVFARELADLGLKVRADALRLHASEVLKNTKGDSARIKMIREEVVPKLKLQAKKSSDTGGGRNAPTPGTRVISDMLRFNSALAKYIPASANPKTVLREGPPREEFKKGAEALVARLQEIIRGLK